MARPKTPTIADDKINYFKEQLYSELSHMITWKGLPPGIPVDYLERNLIRNGFVMFYYDDIIGYDILRCTASGYNRHEKPTIARTYTTSDDMQDYNQERAIRRLSDGQATLEIFNKDKDCVLIQNMDYGQQLTEIVDHFATRLALAQQSFDTSLLWTNVPYIFATDNEDSRLSIEKMFEGIFNGTPFIISDISMFDANKDRAGIPTGITYIGKELLDTINELMMKFRERVGFETAGVDKAERLISAEVNSNNQHTRTCLEIMLRQRQMACDNINAFYDLPEEVTVEITGTEEAALQEEAAAAEDEEGTEENGNFNNGTASPIGTD